MFIKDLLVKHQYCFKTITSFIFNFFIKIINQTPLSFLNWHFAVFYDREKRAANYLKRYYLVLIDLKYQECLYSKLFICLYYFKNLNCFYFGFMEYSKTLMVKYMIRIV